MLTFPKLVHDIDKSCTASGDPANAHSRRQSGIKSNLCAASGHATPTTITDHTLRDLQTDVTNLRTEHKLSRMGAVDFPLDHCDAKPEMSRCSIDASEGSVFDLRCRLAPVIDMSALQMWFAVLIGWFDRQERDGVPDGRESRPARAVGWAAPAPHR